MKVFYISDFYNLGQAKKTFLEMTTVPPCKKDKLFTLCSFRYSLIVLEMSVLCEEQNKSIFLVLKIFAIFFFVANTSLIIYLDK